MVGFLNPLISAAAGLGGALLGGWLSDRREREKRHADFIGRQLAEFYGPLVSLRTEIFARSVLRERISAAADTAWQELVGEARAAGPLASVENIQRVQRERWPSFEALIKDEPDVLRNKLIPAYQQMIATIREKMWLATPETRNRFVSGEFSTLFDHVEILERHLRTPLPAEVIGEIDHREDKVKPLYTHLEETFDRLRLNQETLAHSQGHLRRGLMRLWLALSLIWVIVAGGVFAFQFNGYLGSNVFDRFDAGYWPTRLGIIILPPLLMLGGGTVVAWIARAFRAD
jgi:hypothetical protein